mgnify:FL=1
MTSQSEAVLRHESFLSSLAEVLTALLIFLFLSYSGRNMVVRVIEENFYEATLEVCIFSLGVAVDDLPKLQRKIFCNVSMVTLAATAAHSKDE